MPHTRCVIINERLQRMYRDCASLYDESALCKIMSEACSRCASFRPFIDCIMNEMSCTTIRAFERVMRVKSHRWDAPERYLNVPSTLSIRASQQRFIVAGVRMWKCRALYNACIYTCTACMRSVNAHGAEGTKLRARAPSLWHPGLAVRSHRRGARRTL